MHTRLRRGSPRPPPARAESAALARARQIFDAALSKRLDRGTTFVALGGGVIGDMVGFAAAAYQRGVHFIQARTPPPHAAAAVRRIAARE